MTLLNTELNKSFIQKKVVKIITGLNNFDINYIIKVVKASEIANATYIDIAANTKIVSIIRSFTNLPICVSSIDPIELYNCTLVGANMVEIGNFDSLYTKHLFFSPSQIYQLAKKTKSLINNIDICVTIPHTLILSDQIKLAINLQNLGINVLQTEGLSTKKNIFNKDSNLQDDIIFNSANKASSALSSTYAMANVVNIPIITSSGINSLSAPIAMCYGASAVGIGSALNHYKTIYQMSNYINEIVSSVSYQNKCLYDKKSIKLNSYNLLQNYSQIFLI
uniref:Uncharacterized protein ycf23 n=1 Tax=Inkyuleea mariana TaxID=123988 RepID=A0A4D6WZH1_9FLOR|nr:hypothetical protein [Inkyuleea mariana]